MRNNTRMIVGSLVIGASACSLQVDEAGDVVGNESAAIRLLGTPLPNGSTTPWTRRSTVYSRLNQATTGTTFENGQDAIAEHDLDYYPALIAGAWSTGAARYASVWHKNAAIEDWQWYRRVSSTDLVSHVDEHQADGYVLYDFGVFIENGNRYFQTIWLKYPGQPTSAAEFNLSSDTLTSRMNEYKDAGYRPKRIDAYTISGQARFAVLWINDGLDDFRWGRHMTPEDFNARTLENATEGYKLHNISVNHTGNALRYSAVWINEPENLEVVSSNDFPADTFQDTFEAFTAAGDVLVDLDPYYALDGSLHYAAIWARTEPKDQIQSNLPPSVGLTPLLQALVDGFETDPDVGPAGRIGFFVQDLQSGNYVGYNMDEPFYMASSYKALIAAAVIDSNNSGQWNNLTFRAGDWRGESARGWTTAAIGNTYPLNTWLANMLDNSDSASTDRLLGLMTASDSLGMAKYVKSNFGLQNVGELTSICELDKRISESINPCVRAVSCDTWEAWYRWDKAEPAPKFYQATSTERSCLEGIANEDSRASFEAYYATLANTITPVEYGRALSDIMQGELTMNERAQWLQGMDLPNQNAFNPSALQGVIYDDFFTKAGGKNRARAQIGVTADYTSGTNNDYANVLPRHTFAVFAEGYDDGDYDPRPIMRAINQIALTYVDPRTTQ